MNYYNEFDPSAAAWLRLKGYGNAIVPQQAAAFVSAYMSELVRAEQMERAAA